MNTSPTALACYERLVAARREVSEYELEEMARESKRSQVQRKIMRRLERVA